MLFVIHSNTQGLLLYQYYMSQCVHGLLKLLKQNYI